jgi:hypothetical protein
VIGRIMLEAVKYFSVDILAYLVVSFRLVFFTDDCVVAESHSALMTSP